jgi:hypothetical protein
MGNDIDVMTILGNITINTNMHPKLLLLQFSSMLVNVHYSVEVRNQIAQELYQQLCPLCSRHGHEVTRRGGSFGMISHQSNRDILKCIHNVPGLLPRQLRGVIIIRGVLTYHMVCRNVALSQFVHHQYSPPNKDGAFKMPSQLLCVYPVLVEFEYLKMMGIEILELLNVYQVKDKH